MTALPFWLKPNSIFGFFLLTTFIEGSHNINPIIRSCSSPPYAGRFDQILADLIYGITRGYIVSRASHHHVAMIACLDRKLLTEIVGCISSKDYYTTIK